MSKIEILSRALNYLSREVMLPVQHNGVNIVYRLKLEAESVVVEGFMPFSEDNAGDTLVNVAQDAKQHDALWIAPQVTALADYSLKHDGSPATLVRLNQPMRDHKYEVFSIDSSNVVLRLELTDTLAEAALA